MITQKKLKEQLHYDAKTGLFTWKKAHDARRVGKTAGWLCRKGYRHFRIQGETVKAHRMAFVYMGLDIPDQVDHINHDRDDNRWGNLRIATQNINMGNKKIYKNNKSGFHGVYWRADRKMWVSSVQFRKKRVNLGQYAEKQDAINAVEIAHKEYGFHENHGH